MAELEDWVLELEANGVRSTFSHLDVDIHRVRVAGQDLAGDLAEMTRYFADRDITVGAPPCRWSAPSPVGAVARQRRALSPESLAGTNGSPMSQSRALTPRLHGPS